MTVSLGPYQRGLPFLTIQDIRFDINKENDYLLTVGLSNEKIVKTGKKQREMAFGNFIYFSSDKSEIDAIASDLPALIETIKRNPKNKYFFNVGKKDFKYKADAEGGRKIYNFFHQKEFKLEQTTNLYVLACIFIERSNNFVIGNIIKETILNNSLSPVTADVYSLAETIQPYGSINSVWPGSAHIQNDQIMAGNTHVAQQHPNLSRTGVLNVRLKDLRVVQAARGLNFDFTTVQESYFSPLTLSRGKSGAINGSFTFNLFNFTKNNSKLGGLIQNRTSLLASVSIKDIIIYQRIVGRDARGNSLTPGTSELCGLKEANPFKKVASLNSNCQIVRNINENQAEYYEIFFLDETTEEINSGQAEYEAEIILDDNTDKLVIDSINPLKRNLKMISDVKQIADDPDVYDDIIVDYLASVRSIFGNLPFSTFSTLFWRKNLLSLVNQFNPNYDSDKYLFLSIMRDYVSKLDNIVAQYAPSESKIKNDSKIYRSKKDRLLRAMKEFKEIYQFVGTKNYGFDYVDQTIGESVKVVPSISFGAYGERASTEVSKYEIVNTQIATLNPYGFLSPATLNMTPNPMMVSAASSSIANDSVLSIVSNKVSNKKGFEVNKSLKRENQKRDIFNSLGVGFRKNQISLKDNLASRKRLYRTLDSEEYFSATSEFVYETKPSEAVSGSKQVNIEFEKISSIFNSSLSSKIIDNTITLFNEPTVITNKEMLEGSPASQKLNEQSDFLETSTAATKAINFNSVARVHYLDSYDSLNGVGKQNWKLLTEQKYNDVQQKSQALVCKLVKVSDAIGTNDILDVEPMSSLFVLGSPEVRGGAPLIKINDLVRSTKQDIRESAVSGDLNNVNILYSKSLPMSMVSSQTTTQQALETNNLNTALFNITTTTPSSTGY
jgi:hypothetical protein